MQQTLLQKRVVQKTAEATEDLIGNKFGDKYGKKLMDTATKTGPDASELVSKRVVQKTAEATGDLIENKIADKITSLGKTKSDGKEKEKQEIYIPPEKRK